jgi:23S rRNA G2445 N2-methylase RlmL
MRIAECPMKITIDMDIAPEEVRKLFGLPDVEGFQRQLMDDIRERMMAGAEGYDPIKLLQPYVTGTMAGWDLFQKMLTGATAMAGTASPKTSTKTGDAGKG